MSPLLLDAIEDLRRAERRLELDVERVAERPLPPLERLKQVIAALGEVKAARPPVGSAKYRRHWAEYLNGAGEKLEPRAIRYLCWEPEVATDARFQDYLDRSRVNLGAQPLQGLVRSCHARWSREFAAGPVAARVRRRVESYQGPSRLLKKWQEHSMMILGPRGAEELAAELIEQREAIKTACEEWKLDAQTLYVEQAAQAAARWCRERMRRDDSLRRYLLHELLPWPGWSLVNFKVEVGEVVLHSLTAEDEEFRKSLEQFALGDEQRRLGDPRLPGNQNNWLGVQDAAREQFIQWLSKEDIIFFFEHVLPSRKDPHGRKEFWLHYLKSLKRSRPLLHPDDESRLAQELRQDGRDRRSFGEVRGGTNSVFLLDFGSVLAVEFSRVGAIHIYRHEVINRIVPDFWTRQPFAENDLKRRHLLADLDDDRISHFSGWQYKARERLARYGIRPA
jgi:hypothetical protein